MSIASELQRTISREDVVPPVPVLRFSVQQYHEMGRAGILSPDDRVELLEGWLVPKMMKSCGPTSDGMATTGTFSRIASPSRRRPAIP